MPSQNMLPKGHRRRTVRPEYVVTRGVEPEAPPPVPVLDLARVSGGNGVRSFRADPAAAGLRLDLYLAQALPEISRARVQLLIEAGQVHVDGAPAKPKLKLKGGEAIRIEGEAHPEPLNATPEDIPLDLLFEDPYLAVINKPAGMSVHAGAGSSDDERNRGTLVNALLFHFAKLSAVGGELRPGIVHRLDKQTSGAIVVAKDDVTHRKLGELFAGRAVAKTYLALAHGHLDRDLTTVSLPIARDLVRRTRMTTRRPGGRSAVSHIQVLERLTTPYGAFTQVEVRIETGRTHQIRVHLQALGHPVVGDHLYGAPRTLRLTPNAPVAVPSRPSTPAAKSAPRSVPHASAASPQRSGPFDTLTLDRNYLHAFRLAFPHPRTNKPLTFEAPLPPELTNFLAALTP